jgi:hypothetical protein
MFSSAFLPDLCAKMTLFQFFEGVTDQLAFQAFGCRPKWLEAISFPLDTVDFMPLHLSKFRVEFRNNQLFREALENAQRLLTQTGVLPINGQEICAANIVNAVCLVNHLGSLLAAMNDALGALAATYPEWLQQTMLPHWIERYPWQKCSGLPVSLEEQTVLAIAVADDILYLLRHFDREVGQKRPFLSEVVLLKKLFWAQFTASHHGYLWTPQLYGFCAVPVPV